MSHSIVGYPLGSLSGYPYPLYNRLKVEQVFWGLKMGANGIFFSKTNPITVYLDGTSKPVVPIFRMRLNKTAEKLQYNTRISNSTWLR